TGDSKFEACGTGVDYSPSGPRSEYTDYGPPLDEINAEIAKCNAGTGDRETTSAGWVNTKGAVTSGAIGVLGVGEDNTADAGSFPITCQPKNGAMGIDPQAKWMWYDPSGTGGDNAFHSKGTNYFRSYLIFRLKAGDIIF